MKLDFNLTTLEERKSFLDKYLLHNPNPTPRELEQMADYLIFVEEVEKKGKLLTDNRMVTVNKRETSMEGLTEKLEGGESAFHALVREDKNMILTPKTSITEEDLADIPELKQLRELIEKMEEEIKEMEGPDKAKMRKAIIEMRKDQYAIKNSFKKPIYARSVVQSIPSYNMDGDTGYFNSDGSWNAVSENFLNLWEPKHVSEILANYSTIKEDTWENLDSDLRWVLADLEDAIDKALANEPVLKEILICKIDKLSNEDIQKVLLEKHGKTHSQEYISSLYRNKIPQLIVEQQKEDWVNYIYTEHLPGNYKTCTRCGEVKLALNRYFSINRTSSSKFYSICKVCRNNKN